MGLIGGGGDHHRENNNTNKVAVYHHNQLSLPFLMKKEAAADVPKGCMAVMVGQGEEQKRFVIPVVNINHPLFMGLLEAAEKEYGFDHGGPITIPCHVDEFLAVQSTIDKEKSAVVNGGCGDQDHHNHHHHHHHHQNMWCFRA